jgi:hypothetical protein
MAVGGFQFGDMIPSSEISRNSSLNSDFRNSIACFRLKYNMESVDGTVESGG